MHPDQFLKVYRQARASAILRTGLAEAAAPAMEAAIRGGFRVVEFTLTIPGVLDLIREFSQRAELVVGAGTVLDAHQAEDAVRAGARFLVAPVVDEEIIAQAKALGVAAMPGCATPTEMLKAHRAGAPLQKLFPEPGPGPAWVKQTLGPLPFLRIVPTSGVSLENAARYLEAGAFAVGFVATLFDPSDLKAGAFDRIEQRARDMIAAVQAPES
jgi:Entner-Doudoroff aldolase